MRLLGIPNRVKQQPNFLCRINAKSSKRIQESQPIDLVKLSRVLPLEPNDRFESHFESYVPVFASATGSATRCAYLISRRTTFMAAQCPRGRSVLRVSTKQNGRNARAATLSLSIRSQEEPR